MNISSEIKRQAYELSKSSYLYFFDTFAFIAYLFIFIVWIYALFFFLKKLSVKAIKLKFKKR